MNERQAFEAWARANTTLSLQRDPDDPESYYRASAEGPWLAWQAARAASPVPAEPQQITAERVTRMMAAIEGECDGLAITREHATAILVYVLAASSASPAQQPVVEDQLIAAAEKYAANYDNDDRQHIKTDVLNAFYAGWTFGVIPQPPQGAQQE
jgi:hypothetical protein